MADLQSQHKNLKRKDREDDEDIDSMSALRPKTADGVEVGEPGKCSILTVPEGTRYGPSAFLPLYKR